MQNGIMVHIPPNGAHVIQPMRVVQYADLQREDQTSYQAGPFQRLLKLEATTLGAIQIINGLIHIGFGGVSVCLFNTSYYISVDVLSGYPFWGGILFIASGSLTVAAGKSLKHSLAQCSVRINIASAVMAFIGMFFLSVQLFLNQHSYAPDYFKFQPDFINAVGTGLTILYLLFSILQFCITVWIARLGCLTSANRMEANVVSYILPTEESIHRPMVMKKLCRKGSVEG